jgi:uncharacterized protein (DUF362 family)
MGEAYLTRREFIQRSTCIASGILVTASLPLLSCGAEKLVQKTKASIIHSPHLGGGAPLTRSALTTMLDQGIRSITGYDDTAKAWNTLFRKNDVVALKVNCIGKEFGSTKPELAYAIAASLKSYVGIPYEHIIIFDRYEEELIKAGYLINKSSSGVQIYASSDFSSPIHFGGIAMGLSTIITKECTALINVPLLKTHSGAHLTLNLKNHYGSIPTHIVQDSRLKFHSQDYENIVLVNALAPLREKTRLCIVDGIVAQYDQGPMANPLVQWNCNSIIMGTDPVAADAIGLNIINEQRIAHNLKPFTVQYLKWAEEEGLGVSSVDSIEVITKTV